MNGIILPPRSPNPKAVAILILAALAALSTAGCKKPEPMKLHYLRGFVPGSQHIFYPAKVGVAEVGGKLAGGTHVVGAVYGADGTRERRLAVKDIGHLVRDAIISGLSDAGLKPVALAGRPAAAALPFGVDRMLLCDVERVNVEKNFGSKVTVHGQYFTMYSRVKLRFTLVSRRGEKLYQGEIVGSEKEPPAPVGHEVFFPLETDPAESLSVALSRAVGQFFVEPEVRRVLPVKPSGLPGAAAMPAPSPAPEHPGG